MKENIIQTKSYSFALSVVEMYQKHYKNSDERSLLRQFLASGTSVGANIEEAEGGQSRKDFIAKLSISYKEARETKYWISLLRDSGSFMASDADSLLMDCEEPLRILTAILNTSKRQNS